MTNHPGMAPAPASDDPPIEPTRPPKPGPRLRQPALRVLKGEFRDPPSDWSILDEHRHEIQARLPGVGRIRQGPFVLGTGVLVARNVVLTNGHVARAFSTDVDGDPKIRVGWSPVIDFIGEAPLEPEGAHDDHDHVHVHQPHDDEPCGCCEIRSVLYIDANHDLALLRVAFDDSPGPEHWRRPQPFALNTSEAAIAKNRRIYLIGFPGDDRTATPEEVQTVIGTHFGVKHVQPGVILDLNTGDKDTSEFQHDASTLKGNSGSCVIDVKTNQVIGLHTRGSREALGEVSFNRAIAFARLEPAVLDRLRKAGIELSGTDAPPPQTT